MFIITIVNTCAFRKLKAANLLETMASYYVMNLAGCRLEDEKMRCIPAPRFELFTHITLKNIQSGAFIGGFLVAPITCAVKGEFNRDAILDRSYKYGTKGIHIGAVVGPLMFATWALSAKPNTDGYTDRCYSLRYNKNQVFSDRMCLLGLAAGAGAAKYLGEELSKGAFFGFTGGLLTAGIINTVAGFL